MLLVPLDSANEVDNSISYAPLDGHTAGREIIDDALHVAGVRTAAERFACTTVQLVDTDSEVGGHIVY